MTANDLLLPIDAPEYTDRRKVRGWTIPVSALSVGPRAAARMLRRALPDWTRADHAAQSVACSREADAMDAAWGRVANEAARAAWGRDWEFTDYRISGIGSDDFRPADRDRLRSLAHARTAYLAAAAAHAVAAGVMAMRRAAAQGGAS